MSMKGLLNFRQKRFLPMYHAHTFFPPFPSAICLGFQTRGSKKFNDISLMAELSFFLCFLFPFEKKDSCSFQKFPRNFRRNGIIFLDWDLIYQGENKSWRSAQSFSCWIGWKAKKTRKGLFILKKYYPNNWSWKFSTLFVSVAWSQKPETKIKRFSRE